MFFFFNTGDSLFNRCQLAKIPFSSVKLHCH